MDHQGLQRNAFTTSPPVLKNIRNDSDLLRKSAWVQYSVGNVWYVQPMGKLAASAPADHNALLEEDILCVSLLEKVWAVLLAELPSLAGNIET